MRQLTAPSFGCWHRGNGQAVLETAIVMPLIALLILGIAELGSAITSNMSIANVAREAARIAARGGVYPDTDVRDLILGNAGSVDLQARGSVVVTEVTSKTGLFTSYESRTLVGSKSSRLTEANLATMHSAASSSDPTFLGNDKFVVVEVFYDHKTITGFLADHFEMYANAIMPVSAPS